MIIVTWAIDGTDVIERRVDQPTVVYHAGTRELAEALIAERRRFYETLIEIRLALNDIRRC